MWTGPGESAPKKVKTVPSASKVMATIFWDSTWYNINRLSTEKKNYYRRVLNRFYVILKEKRPHLAKKKVLSHHHNAPAHTSAIATAKLFDLHYEILSHPPYSPDLAPSDYFSFPNMKTWLGNKRFASNEEIIAATNEYFAEFDKKFFFRGHKEA